MLKKSLTVLKNNPVLILLYAAFVVVSTMILFFLYPRDMGRYLNVESFNLYSYMVMMVKMLYAIFLLSVLGFVFIVGYGSMVAEAVMMGRTSAKSFFTGLKKFFVRMLLAMLLYYAMAIGFSTIFSTVSMPFIIISAMKTASTMAYDPSASMNISIGITFAMLLLMIFLFPFVLLWFPAIFTENIGVFQALKSGAKAGVKNYWKLLLILIVIYIPMVIYLFFNYKSIMGGAVLTPWLLLVYLVEAVIVIAALPVLYFIYLKYRYPEVGYPTEGTL
jgi:hypothetical protein